MFVVDDRLLLWLGDSRLDNPRLGDSKPLLGCDAWTSDDSDNGHDGDSDDDDDDDDDRNV